MSFSKVSGHQILYCKVMKLIFIVFEDSICIFAGPLYSIVIEADDGDCIVAEEMDIV
jgi:hypothetical protein